MCDISNVNPNLTMQTAISRHKLDDIRENITVEVNVVDID